MKVEKSKPMKTILDKSSSTKKNQQTVFRHHGIAAQPTLNMLFRRPKMQKKVFYILLTP